MIDFTRIGLVTNDRSDILSASLDGNIFEWVVGEEDSHTLCCHHDTCVDRADYIDDNKIISVSSDGQVKISVREGDGVWKTVNSFECIPADSLRQLTPTVGTNRAYLTDDPEVIYTSHWDGFIRRWRLKEVGADCELTFEGHKDWVYACVFPDDRSTMYSSSRDGTVIRWNLETGAVIKTVQLGRGSIYTLDLSDNGELLCAVSDKSAVILDFDNQKITTELTGHDGRVFSAFFDRKKRRVVTFSEDSTIRVWRSADAVCELTLPNIMGIIITGCSLENLRRPFSEAENKIISFYGGYC